MEWTIKDCFTAETVQNNAKRYNNINSMRDRCTLHVALHISYMIQQKNIINFFTHMTSNMLTLLACLWQIAADVAGTDKVQ